MNESKQKRRIKWSTNLLSELEMHLPNGIETQDLNAVIDLL
ncbi:hypothetical protein [Methylophaga sp.]|nr:hypothetical protein [Methylophaga sp.]MDO8826146.1 hypothetical protein [Methylophaga sp.]